ncbi:oligosaccharide flippase family protein [uncultured Pontibacter sp.]|uniref:lipopolysaccharide biosynthesis protein n=1 Tax=uncultured Pontibacter sp. TaxID=453356 RepID=UPI00262EBEB6|nr:oligosaccharide flippase family protein [uncultured Pontibacter sp.]
MLKIKSDLTKKVLQGSFINMIGAVVTNFTRFLLVFILARYYIKEEFGIWVTITSITAILATGDFGIGNALRNKLSLFITQGKDADKHAERYYLTVLHVLIYVTIFISIVLYYLQGYIPLQELFKTDSASIKSIGKEIIVWVQIILLLGIPFSISNTCFYSYHESRIVAYLSITQAIITFGATCILALTGQSIVVISLVFFTSTLLMYVAGTFIFIKKRGWHFLNIQLPGAINIIKEMVIKGFPFFALQMSSAFLFNAGTVIMSSTVGLTSATEYNLVQKLYLFILGIYQAAFNPMWAGYAHAINTQAWEWCRKTLRNSLMITFIIFASATIGITILGNFALSILAGEKYVTDVTLFILLGSWITLYTLWACAQTLQSATNRINLLVITTLIAAICITPFSKFMIGYMGVNGLLCAQIIIYFILALATVTEAFYLIKIKSKAQPVLS